MTFALLMCFFWWFALVAATETTELDLLLQTESIHNWHHRDITLSRKEVKEVKDSARAQMATTIPLTSPWFWRGEPSCQEHYAQKQQRKCAHSDTVGRLSADCRLCVYDGTRL